MKAAVRVGGFTLPPQTVSRCLLLHYARMQWSHWLAVASAGLFLNFLRCKVDKFSPFGGSWILCSLALKPCCIYLCFHTCLELYFSSYSKIMGAVWGKSTEPYSRCSHLIWFGLGQKSPRAWKQLLQHIICAYTGWEKSLAAGEVVWLISSCCHPSLAPEWAVVQGGPTHGCSLGNLEQEVSPQWATMWLKEALATWQACPCSTYMLHLVLKPSHTCLDVGLGALHHCGSEANIRRKSTIVRHFFLWGWGRPQAALRWLWGGESNSSSRRTFFNVQLHLQYGKLPQLLLKCCCLVPV